MFGNNNFIQGGEFIINNVNSEQAGFKSLQQRVASAAFHNSAQRVDSPRCHPNTRVAVLQMIYDWIVAAGAGRDREKWLLWLNGAAGAWKSAIMRSIAEQCVLYGVPIASFFFFRANSTRNKIAPLVATLAYQLIQTVPETAPDILRIIERNPLIFEQSFEYQLKQLMVDPLLRIGRGVQCPFVVMIDGLDECAERNIQSSLISIVSSIVSAKDVPIIFLIASRQEPHLAMSFRQEDIAELLVTMPLDNVQQASYDIHNFVMDKFEQIKNTHPHAHNIPENWPPPSAIDEIIEKSSGQFIYASDAINYVSSPRANPAHQLDIIKGIRTRHPSSQNPFAHLDALYHHIFSQVEHIDMVLNILAFSLLAKEQEIDTIQHIFQLAQGELKVYLADLTSVISCVSTTKRRNAEINFLHASLPDFLFDKSRSECYYNNPGKYRTKLACMLLDRPPPPLNPLPLANNLSSVARHEWYRLRGIRVLLESAKASDELLRSFLNFDMKFYSPEMVKETANHCIWVLDCVSALVYFRVEF